MRKIAFALLRIPGIGRLLVRLFRQRLLNVSVWGGEVMQHDIEDQVAIFVPEEQRADRRYMSRLTTDIIWSYFRYGATPQEYFLFDFEHCDARRRGEFLTNKHKDLVMIEKVGMGENWELLEDKALFYERFHDYFLRDVHIPRKGGDKEAFMAFCSKHSSFILKKVDGQCGKGIERMEVAHEDLDALYERLTNGKYIMEEIIRQRPEMAAFNESSVNTVRIPSFMKHGEQLILKPYMRMGRKGAVVDNGNSGGIYAIVDAATGRTGDGLDLKGNVYPVHPDSKVAINGFQIPDWDDLMKLVRKVHGELPDYPYIGWDFALSEKGWVLVEGNWGQFLSEFGDREGIKRKFDSMFE